MSEHYDPPYDPNNRLPELPRQPIRVDTVRPPARIVNLKLGDHVTIDGWSGQIGGYSFVGGVLTIVCDGAIGPKMIVAEQVGPSREFLEEGSS